MASSNSFFAWSRSLALSSCCLWRSTNSAKERGFAGLFVAKDRRGREAPRGGTKVDRPWTPDLFPMGRRRRRQIGQSLFKELNCWVALHGPCMTDSLTLSFTTFSFFASMTLENFQKFFVSHSYYGRFQNHTAPILLIGAFDVEVGTSALIIPHHTACARKRRWELLRFYI